MFYANQKMLASLRSIQSCHYTKMITDDNQIRQGRPLKRLETYETGTT
jgi:hypothetical protein